MKRPLKRVLLLFTYEFQFRQLYILHEKAIEKAFVPRHPHVNSSGEGILPVIHLHWLFQCIYLLILRGCYFSFSGIKFPNIHTTLFFIFVRYFHNLVGSKVLPWFLRVLGIFFLFLLSSHLAFVFFSLLPKYSNSIILNLLNQHHHPNKPKT